MTIPFVKRDPSTGEWEAWGDFEVRGQTTATVWAEGHGMTKEEALRQAEEDALQKAEKDGLDWGSMHVAKYAAKEKDPHGLDSEWRDVFYIG